MCGKGYRQSRRRRLRGAAGMASRASRRPLRELCAIVDNALMGEARMYSCSESEPLVIVVVESSQGWLASKVVEWWRLWTGSGI